MKDYNLKEIICPDCKIQMKKAAKILEKRGDEYYCEKCKQHFILELNCITNILEFITICTKINSKQIIKQAIKDITLINKINNIKDLHPATINEIQNHVHQIQNILIAEYIRYTELKDEFDLI